MPRMMLRFLTGVTILLAISSMAKAQSPAGKTALDVQRHRRLTGVSVGPL